VVADYNSYSGESSKHLLRNTSNEVSYLCKSGQDRESQLKETIDELSTAQMIITILQTELLTYRASTTMCEVSLTITDKSQNKLKTDEWITAAQKNRNIKLQERPKHNEDETVLTGIDIPTKNRFLSLANLEGNESASLQRATNPTKHQVKGTKIPTIVNGRFEYYKEFPSLTNKQENPVWTSAKHIQKKKRLPQLMESSSSSGTTHKVLIIGDSHARNCADLLQDNLSTDFKVTSFVKPGASMNEIVNTARNEIKTLQSDDLIVVWGGANDIRKNNMREAMKSVSKFVDTNQDLNIVLIILLADMI